MKKNDNLFYASDVNVEPEEIEEVKTNEPDPEKIGVIVEEKLKSLLIKKEEKVDPEKGSFPEDWFACRNCGNVFEVEKGDRVECPGCGYFFANKNGELITLEVPGESEELIEEEIEEGEEEEGLKVEFVDFDEWIDGLSGREGGEDKEGEEEEEEERSDLDKILSGE